MKVVILTNNQGNQKALCNKIAAQCEVAAIVLSENIPRRKPSAFKRAQMFANRIASRTAGRAFVQVWFEMQSEYNDWFQGFPNVPIIKVKNVNDSATVEALMKFAPALTVVSGTNLVGKNVIKASTKGIVNLHTGISPYVKGGPNCTNWCLSKNWFHLIGSTVMWLDLGIDTGNIIATEQAPLNGNENLFELHWKVMEHAHDLYTRAIKKIILGKQVPSIPQKMIAEGKNFYSVNWNGAKMRRALKNFHNNYNNFFDDAERRKKLSTEIKLFPLNE